MRFKNSIRLIFENFGTIYKVLVYRLIIMTLLVCLVAALIMPNITLILDSSELKNVFNVTKQFIKSVFNGTVDGTYGDKFKDTLTEFYEFVKLKSGRIILSGFYFVVIYIIGKFLNGLSNYALGGMINDHMSSLAHLGFTQSLVRDLKKASLYQIVYVAINIVYDLLTVFICYNILFGLFGIFKLISIVLASSSFVMLYAFKLTYLSNLMPAMIADGYGLKKAFKSSFSLEKKQLGRIFSNYVVCVLLIIYINVTMAIFTFFSSLFITVPLSYLFIVCLQFVNYYSISNKKYFINYDNIIIPKNLREEEKLLDNIEI